MLGILATRVGTQINIGGNRYFYYIDCDDSIRVYTYVSMLIKLHILSM